MLICIHSRRSTSCWLYSIKESLQWQFTYRNIPMERKKWKCCMSTNQQKIFYSWFKCHPVFPFQQFWMKYDCMFFLAFPPSAQLSYRSSSSSSRKWGQIHQWMVGQWGSVVASISTNTACCVGLSPSQPWQFSYTWLADYYVPHCGNMPQQCICFGDTIICDCVFGEQALAFDFI